MTSGTREGEQETIIVYPVNKVYVIPSDSEEEVLFERQLISLAEDLKIPINSESSSEDIEFISSYLTFIKFARVFAPEPGAFLSAYSHKSGDTHCSEQNVERICIYRHHEGSERLLYRLKAQIC